MRILYLITRAVHGGAQSHLLELARAAAARAEVLVATGESGPLTESFEDIGLRCVILNHLKYAPSLLHDLLGCREIARLIRRFDPDIVHAHSGKAGLLGRLGAAYEHVPSIYTAHGYAFSSQQSAARRVASLAGEWIAGRAGSFSIVVSASECRVGMRHRVIKPGTSAVIYNGVSTALLRAVPEAEPPIVAMIARFAPPKDQSLLIRAFLRLSSNARLWLVGDGPQLATNRVLVERAGAKDRVLFWGDRKDAADLLSQAQIAALISGRESFGLSLIEAMSIGLPVIASEVGGMREIVRHGETGLLVRPNDEIALANALARLINDPPLRMRMGQAGRELCEKQFSSRRMVADTFRVYERILGGVLHQEGSGCLTCAFPRTCSRVVDMSGD